jgi:hypothetical protein
MIKLNLEIDYNIPEEYRTNEDGEVTSYAELTIGYIGSAVGAKYEKGLTGSKTRMWGRIQRKFDDVLDNKKKAVELEDAEFEFISKAVLDENVPYKAAVAKFVMLLQEEIERIKFLEEGEEEPKKSKKKKS